MPRLQAPPALHAHLAFASHVIGGTVSFFVVYGVALLASAGAEKLNAVLHAPVWLRLIGVWIEAIVLIGDVVALALLLVLEIARLAMKLWEEWRALDG